MSEKNAPLSAHLKELRKRALVSLIAVIVMMAVSFAVLREWLMNLLTSPFGATFKESLVFIGVSEAFIAYLKVSLLAGFVLASPIVLWQLFAFILPAFYKDEKRVLFIVTGVGTLLFIGGIVFSYMFVLQPTLKVLISGFSGGFQPAITISYYLSFVLKFLLPFGLAFEIPLVVYFLTKMNLVSTRQLKAWRKYILIVILVAAAILTPPDIFSQTLLAAPMYVLFELSILVGRLVERKRAKQEE